MNPLVELHKFGQSFWYDNMSRSLISSGELARMVAEDGLRGMTSNPTIFEKAIAGSSDYDTEIAELAARDLTPFEICEELMVTDIRNAADVLRPVYDSSDGILDTTTLIDNWQWIAEPGVMVTTVPTLN